MVREFTSSCEYCHGRVFTVIDGLYFCNECGQSNQVVEMELEEENAADKTAGVNLKVEKAREESRITSWEEYNYILAGLVNELLSLGANREFKKTVFKLWTRYLQVIEAAFFSIDDNLLPKLPANYEKRDAEILYNKHHRKRRRNSVVSKTGSGKAESIVNVNKISRLVNQTKRALAAHQYQSFLEQSQQSETSMSLSLTTTQSTSGDEGVTIDLQFSKNARRLMKRSMSKGHIKNHESDHESNLDCHSNHFKSNRADLTETLSNKVLLSIIVIALNLTNDPIQLSDIVRFLREGHLSYFNVQRFLPENILQEKSLSFEDLTHSKIWFHHAMRLMVVKLCKDISVPTLNLPNMMSLAQRYVEDLGLPEDMLDLVEKFILFYPPEMPYDPQTSSHLIMSPNYEGRAMSYVLFVIKILFGLDGQRETIISDSARKVNQIFVEQDIALFVVDDWLEYLRLRQIFLCKHHPPSSISANKSKEHNPEKYLKHLKTVYENKAELNTGKRRAQTSYKILVAKVFELLQSMKGGKFGSDHATDEDQLHFPSSLTPSKDYMREIVKSVLNSDSNTKAVDRLLRCDFTKSHLKIFHQCPESLKELKIHLFDKYNLVFKLREIGLDPKNLYIIKISKSEPRIWSKLTTKYSLEFCEEKEWKKLRKVPKTCLPKRETTTNLAYEFHKSKFRTYEKSNFQDTKDEDVTPDVELKVTNFDHWIQSVTCLTYACPFKTEDYEQLQNLMPVNFKFLLEECARVIEQDPKYLLLEFMKLEKKFIYDFNPEFGNFEKDKIDKNYKVLGPTFKYLW